MHRVPFCALLAWVLPIGALTWTNPNGVTPQTLALYHFDEAAGSVASNAVDATRLILLETAAMRATITNGWLAGVTRVLALTNGYTATCPRFDLAQTWTTHDLTLSFWLRHQAHGPNPAGLPALDPTNTARCGLDWPHAGLPLLQSWWRAVPLSATTLTWNGLADGAWHHFAYAYRASQQQVAWYFDNVLITNLAGTIGETNTMFTALTLGTLPAAELWSADELDELLLENACLADFSNGNLPEPGALLLLLMFAALAQRH